MKSLEKKLIILSFSLAILASIAVFGYLNSLKAPREEIDKIKILVAVETIPPRTLITDKMIRELEVPDSPIFNEYITDITKILGKYTKETILKNEGFHRDKLINQGEEELSLKIPTNYRAISINVTGDTGVAHLIKPGDFVDVVLYLPEKTEGSEKVRPDLSKMIMQNVEVLALDKQMLRDEKQREDEVIPSNFLVTLSLPIVEVEKLVLAESIGSLKLALRPLRDNGTKETKAITWEDLVNWIDNNTTNPQATNTTNTTNIPNTTKYITHIIKPGETLRQISRIYYGNADNYIIIREFNRIQDENLIKHGQPIKVPVLN